MGKNVLIGLIFILGVTTFIPDAFAQSPFTGFEHLFTPPKQYTIYKKEGEILVDGKPEESAWKAAPWTDYFLDIEGEKKPTPAFKTRTKMLWDNHALYILAELEEPHIWATLKEHDQVIFYDNDFEVFIDPNGNAHDYFEIEVNAYATVFDLFMPKPYRNRGLAFIPWNAKGLQVAVSVNGTINNPSDKDKGWTIEMAIPFSSISMGNHTKIPETGEVWRINFSRVQWDVLVENGKYHKKINNETSKPFPEHNWVWSPQGVINMHYPERWGYAEFSTSMEEEKNVQIMLPDVERAKDYLWLIYYKQDWFYHQNKKFAKNLTELGIDDDQLRLPNGACSLEMESNSQQYMVLMKCQNKYLLKITNEGLISQQLIENPE